MMVQLRMMDDAGDHLSHEGPNAIHAPIASMTSTPTQDQLQANATEPKHQHCKDSQRNEVA
jgi:hypothetical protein